MFGNPETTTGGNALKFYSSVRLDIRRIGAIKSGEEVVGNQTRVKVVKNKVAPPFREAEFEIMYGKGISREGEIIDMGSTQGIIEKSGAWYSYKGERIGQGKDNARDFLKGRPELAKEIEDQIRAKLVPVKPQRPGSRASAETTDRRNRRGGDSLQTCLRHDCNRAQRWLPVAPRLRRIRAARAADTWVLEATTLYPAPDVPAISNAVVLVQGGKIVAAGPVTMCTFRRTRVSRNAVAEW
jgi:hypothetical protein